MNVNELIEVAKDSPDLQRTQANNAATIVAQFILVKQGLSGRVGPHEIDNVAAILTAAVWPVRK
jgi:hypothetical protein